MLSRVAFLSLLLGACAPAALPSVKAVASTPLARTAPGTASPRATRVRRVARLSPPFATATIERRVQVREPEAVTAFVTAP